MRLMGEQFVLGQTIAEALANSRKAEARGFRHSYDMLGEAALTAADAEHYLHAYEQAIHAIGTAARPGGSTTAPASPSSSPPCIRATPAPSASA